jgi:hypothetical protein
MPTKIAEAQFFHVAEQHKALIMTIPFNGDPLDSQALENFTFEVRERHLCRCRETSRSSQHPAPGNALSASE